MPLLLDRPWEPDKRRYLTSHYWRCCGGWRFLLFIDPGLFLKKIAKQISDFPRRIPKDKHENDRDLAKRLT
jgi:hypothetical protein